MLPSAILNTALLGTAKHTATPDLPPALAAYLPQLQGDSPEAAHYRLAALGFAYAYGGGSPVQTGGAWQAVPVAPVDPQERHPLPALTAILLRWLEGGQRHLAAWACETLAARGFSLPPDAVPALLAALNPATLPAILLGSRGRWLLGELGQRNYENDSTIDPDEANHSGRKHWLRRVRASDPAAARDKVGQWWQSAPATQRDEYLALFAIGLGADDEAFLTQALSDRSKTVRRTAADLLRRLPGSALQRQYQSELAARLQYSGDAKKPWHYTPQPYTDTLKQLGIEQISPDKKESDDDYILRQLILALPLDAWAEVLHTDAATAATILATHRPLLRNLRREDWVDSMDDPRFTRAILTARWPQLPDDIRHRLLARLTPAEREAVLATPGLDHSLLSRSYNNSEIFDPAQPWGPLYSRAVFEGILHSTLLKKYGSTNDAERCAVCLDTRATADTIAALPAHPAFMDSTFLDALHQYAGEKQTFLNLLDNQPGQPYPNPQEPQP